MTARTALLLVFCSLLVAPLSRAQAQEEGDDLLAPLPPSGKRPEGKRRKKPRPTPAATAPEEPEKSGKALLSFNLPTGGEGARLFVDGNEVGALHAEEPPRPVAAGTHRILVKRAGYKDFTTTLSAKAGAVTQVPVTLEPVAGVATILSEPSGAEVSLDGNPIGVTPMRDYELTPGNHELVLRHSGFGAHVEKLSVRAGREYNISPKLQSSPSDRPERNHLQPSTTGMADTPAPLAGTTQTQVAQATPWYGQWYVWAGAAVVAGAAVGVAVATQPHALSSKQVCGDSPCVLVNAPSGTAAILRF